MLSFLFFYINLNTLWFKSKDLQKHVFVQFTLRIIEDAKFFILICNWRENFQEKKRIYKTKAKSSCKFSNFYTNILNII